MNHLLKGFMLIVIFIVIFTVLSWYVFGGTKIELVNTDAAITNNPGVSSYGILEDEEMPSQFLQLTFTMKNNGRRSIGDDQDFLSIHYDSDFISDYIQSTSSFYGYTAPHTFDAGKMSEFILAYGLSDSIEMAPEFIKSQAQDGVITITLSPTEQVTLQIE